MSKRRGVFVTGTDTEVGKTHYSCRLLRTLNKQGISTAAMKPVASGAAYIETRLRNDDALQLLAAANTTTDYETCNPYCFEPAIAPHLAARQAGQRIDLNVIASHFSILQKQADITIVEGVGGWLVPLNESQRVADLAMQLKLPVILVVGMRLGCINHALLSAEAIIDSGLELLGWVANTMETDFPMFEENIEAIGQRLSVPCLDVLPWQQTRNNIHDEMALNISWL